MSMLSIFTTSSNSFEDQKSYENVLVLVRRHWFILISQMVVFLFLFFMPFIVYFATRSGLARINGEPMFWFLVGIYFLVWWSSLFYSITMYLLDVWIVTDHRVIDSEQHGFFNRTVAELSLGVIQDIFVEINGIIPTWLHYGNLEVQTGGPREKFFFKQVPNPLTIKNIVMSARTQFVEIHRDGVEVHEVQPAPVTPPTV